MKAKSTLVACGFKQREEIDFGETFAPAVSSSCVHLLSPIACECDLDYDFDFFIELSHKLMSKIQPVVTR